jgi:putative transcriptional regulator
MADVRAARKRLGLSQAEFATRFGFQPATLRNWEQGRTRPDGPARVLLAVIARHPEAVEDALRGGDP